MRHRLSKRIIIGVGILIVLYVGVQLFNHLNGPSQGVVTAINTQKAAAVVSFPLRPVTVTNQYANFRYPLALTPLASQQNQAPILASFIYGYKDTESWRLAITITQLHGSSFEDDGSYQLRASQPSIYQKSSASYNGKSYIIMTDTQASGFSEVAYTLHGTTSAEISLYGNDENGTANLVRTFALVLSSWHWN